MTASVLRTVALCSVTMVNALHARPVALHDVDLTRPVERNGCGVVTSAGEGAITPGSATSAEGGTAHRCRTPYAGSATVDSDIFIVGVRDLVKQRAAPQNITNNAAAVDDDPDWSPDGRTIVFTSHLTTGDYRNAVSAEIYTIRADGTRSPRALTSNRDEERAPAWSPDGRRIVFSCRRGGKRDFDICIINADGSGEMKVTDSPLPDLTPAWSPDGTKIVLHRPRQNGVKGWDLWVVNADGTGERRLTHAPGHNGFASWRGIRRFEGPSGYPRGRRRQPWRNRDR